MKRHVFRCLCILLCGAGSFVQAQDVGVTALSSPATACGHSFNETVTIEIENFTAVAVPANTFSVKYVVGNDSSTQLVNVILPALSTISFSFSSATNMSVAGTYDFTIYSIYGADTDNSNDTTQVQVESFANSIGGTLVAPDTVCANSNTDTLILSAYLGTIEFWEIDTGLGFGGFFNLDTFFVYNNLTTTTSYRAVVRNGVCGQDRSSVVTIQVDDPSVGGSITGADSICDNSNSGALTLGGETGNVLQWETGPSNTGPWTNIGSTGLTTLNYTNIQTGDDLFYRAIVQNGVCPQDSSGVHEFVLDSGSVGGTVGLNSGNDTVCASGNTGGLILTGHTGTILRWESSTGGAFSDFGTAANPMTFNNLTTTTDFRAVVKNGTCDSVFSTTFTITVDSASVGGTVSSDQTVCAGTNGGTLTLTGELGNVVDWEISTNGGAVYTPAPGSPTTTLTYTYSNLSTTTLFRTVVKNGLCPTIQSTPATITVVSASAGGTITASGATTVCAGNNSDTLTYSGGSGTIIRWERSVNNGASWTNLGVSATTFVYNNLTDTTWFRVIVQNTPCPIAISDTMIITTLPASVAGSISGTSSVCSGDNANLNLTGQSGTINIWQVSTNGGASYTNVVGSAGLTNITPVVSVNSQFRVIVQNGGCDNDTTTPFSVTADPATVPGIVTSSAVECAGNNSATLTLSGHTGSILDWLLSTNDGTSWTPVSGTPNTTITQTYTNLTDTTWYRARLKSGSCPEDSSGIAMIDVIPLGVGGSITLSTPNDTLCVSNNILTTLSLSGENGTLVDWQVSTNGGASYTPVGGAVTNPKSFFFNYTTDVEFRAAVQNGAACDTVYSTIVPIVVNQPSIGGTLSGGTTVCGGSNSGNIIVSGHTGSVVRWESSDNNGASWTLVASSGDTVAYAGLNDTTWYRAKVKNGECDTAISDTAIVNIIPAAIGGNVTYAGPNVCSGTNMVTLTLSGSVGQILRWQKSTNMGASFTNMGAGDTTAVITDSNLTTTTIYRARLQEGTCPIVFSDSDTVFVDVPSNGGTALGATTVCETSNSGQVFITGHTGSVDMWQQSLNGGGFTNVAITSDTLNYSSLSAGTIAYRALVTNGVCAQDTSTTVTITIDTAVVAGTISGGGVSYCDTNNATLLTLNGYQTQVVRWQQSLTPGVWTNISGTSNRDTITFKDVTQNTNYRAIVSSGVCGNDTTDSVSITVGQSVGGTISSSNPLTVCEGDTGVLTLTGNIGTILAWQDSTNGGTWANHVPSNAGFDTLQYNDLADTLSFRVMVRNGTCDTTFSNIITINTNDSVNAGTLADSESYCDINNADTITLTGYVGPILNWQRSINGGGFTSLIPANTTDTLSYMNLSDSLTEYRVIMDGGICGNDTSNIVTVEVGATLAGTLAASDTVCGNNNTGLLLLTGYRGSILGWDSSTTAGVWFPISNTTDSLRFVNLNDTVSYRVRVQNTTCPADTSDSVTITTQPAPNIGTLLSSKEFCTTTFVDTLVLSGGTATVLGWESSTDTGQTWTPIANTTDSLPISNLTQTTQYRVQIQGGGFCPDLYSNIVIIQVGPSTAGTISGDTLVCAGSNVTLTTNGSIGTILNWLFSTNGGANFDTIPNTDTSMITVPINVNTLFRVISQSDTCIPDTSASFAVNVNTPYNGNLVSSTTQLCYGIGSDTIFITDPVDTIYGWEIRPDTATNWTDLNNDTTFQTYDTLKITTHYRAFVQNGICPVDTLTITMTVDTFSVGGTLAQNDTVCSGDNSGTIILSGHIGNNFNWESSTNGGANWNPAGTNDTFIVYNNLTDTTLYRVIVASGGCPADTSDTVQIAVKPAAVAGLLLEDTMYCEGSNSGTLLLTGYTGNITNWEMSENGGAFTPMSPPVTDDSLPYQDVSVTTQYRVTVSLGDCPDDTSNIVTITILPNPVASISANGPTEFCEGESVTLTASGGPPYSWSNGDTNNTVTISQTSVVSVTVTDTNGCIGVDSISVTATVAPVVDAGPDVTVVIGNTTQFNASGASSYSWSPATNLDNSLLQDPIFTGNSLGSITYVVTGTDVTNCTGEDSLVVTVIADTATTEDSTQFHNLFTPNGDGFNDTWKIRTLANCNVCQVSVYNRYGQIVYEDSNYQDDWEGTFNGNELPDGTYYYIIDSDTGKIFKGAITILRGK